MRRVSNAVVRAFVVLSVMVVLAMPAQARAVRGGGEDGSWLQMKRERIVKFINKIRGGIVSFGDGLTDPKP